ncbi:hypothetical protein V1525DRAFT_399909 [Lipomyces kononenkoae]|uniref:Uncharacterized protein n=1 Tax=Lipomyces kononenkoae TaxID=34357 RepID=A0ACC3T4R9_LIPKO
MPSSPEWASLSARHKSPSSPLEYAGLNLHPEEKESGSTVLLSPSPIDDTAFLLPDPIPDRTSGSTDKSANKDDKREVDENDGSGVERVPLWRLYLFRIQKYSSYSFATFLSMHLATVNAMPALLGIDAADNGIVLARVLYQLPLVEGLVVGSLAAHLISGVVLRIHKIRRDKSWYARRLKMSRVSFTGYLLAPLVAAHVFVARVLPLITEGDSSIISLRYISRGFARSPLTSWSIYVAMLGLSIYHVGYGFSRWLRIRKHSVQIAGVIYFALGIWGLRVVSQGNNMPEWLARKYDIIYGMF